MYMCIYIYILCNQKEFWLCLKMVYTPIYVSFNR
jgi:hypothetical protein